VETTAGRKRKRSAGHSGSASERRESTSPTASRTSNPLTLIRPEAQKVSGLFYFWFCWKRNLANCLTAPSENIENRSAPSGSARSAIVIAPQGHSKACGQCCGVSWKPNPRHIPHPTIGLTFQSRGFNIKDRQRDSCLARHTSHFSSSDSRSKSSRLRTQLSVGSSIPTVCILSFDGPDFFQPTSRVKSFPRRNPTSQQK